MTGAELSAAWAVAPIAVSRARFAIGEEPCAASPTPRLVAAEARATDATPVTPRNNRRRVIAHRLHISLFSLTWRRTFFADTPQKGAGAAWEAAPPLVPGQAERSRPGR